MNRWVWMDGWVGGWMTRGNERKNGGGRMRGVDRWMINAVFYFYSRCLSKYQKTCYPGMAPRSNQ